MKKTKFYNEELTQTRVINNILRVYRKASILDLSRDWYKEAYDFAVGTAIDFDWKVSPEQVCAIIAALSPKCQWSRNKDLTIQFLENYFAGEWNKTRCLGMSKQKAYQIASLPNTERDNTELMESILSGSKISAFFDNILNYSTSERVTIDRHALSVLLGFKLTQEHFQNHKMTKNHYAFFSGCYSNAARKMNISPLKMQAITWEILRADHKNALSSSINLLNLK